MDSIIKHELIRLNAHLPESRLSLREALSLSHPQISTKDGGVHAFKRDELKTLSKMLPASSWESLYLPILISLEPKLGRGAARISGEVEVQVASQILGKEITGREMIIYRPEVAVLRRRLPTASQYMFVW